LFGVLIDFILPMPEGVDPRQSHPVLSDDQLIEEGQVHAIDQTPMEGV